MNLMDLLSDFREQKRPPEELAGDYAEAVVKASYQDMSTFRYALMAQSPRSREANNKYQAYTTMVVLFAAKNPQYIKKINSYSASIEPTSSIMNR